MSTNSGAKFLAEAGEAWTVPHSQGAYPTFATNATEDEKKREISEFIEAIAKALLYFNHAVFVDSFDEHSF